MGRLMFEFQRGKGSMLDWQQENIAYFGIRASYFNTKPKPGARKLTSRRKGVIYPLRWYGPPSRHHLYLLMRSRIGHGHFKGITKPERS